MTINDKLRSAIKEIEKHEACLMDAKYDAVDLIEEATKEKRLSLGHAMGAVGIRQEAMSHWRSRRKVPKTSNVLKVLKALLLVRA